MDDYPAPTPAPGTPPTPAYQAPPPAYQAPQAPPQGGYAPQPGYAPRAAQPKKKKTVLWIVIGLVVLGLLGCCGMGAFVMFVANAAGNPTDSIDAINQAALDGDSAAFEKYFDVESVSDAAYDDFLEYIKGTEDYDSMVAEVGEDEADRMLREEILPKDAFVEELAGEFSIDSLAAGEVPFPGYTVSSSDVDNDTAELTIVTIDDGEEMTYILKLEKVSVGGEEVWQIKEILNLADMLEEQL